MRILVTITPRMYREAIALSLHRYRPDVDVRIASPKAAVEEIKSFRPHLLVRNDTDGLDERNLQSVPFWVEVRYSDGMDAMISADGSLEEVEDMSTERLLRIADEAAARLGGA